MTRTYFFSADQLEQERTRARTQRLGLWPEIGCVLQSGP